MEGDTGRPKRATRKGKPALEAMKDQPQDLAELGAAAPLLGNNPQIGQGNETPELMHMEGAIPKGLGNRPLNSDLG